MIRIHITRYPLRITTKGHATGAGEPGENLVCCSVSTMMYNLVAAANEFDFSCTSKEDDGFMEVTYEPRPAKYKEAEDAFRTIMAGLESLASQYPEYIMIRKEYD